MTVRPFLATRLLAACFAASVAGMAAAQSTLDRAVIGATAPLTEAQKATLAGFADKSIATIRDSDDSAEIADARAALIVPARDPGATSSFRKGYSALLVAELAPTVKGKDLLRAVNAMQVLRFARTQEVGDILIDRLSVAGETDPAKRIAAASLLADLAEDLDAGNAYFEPAARRVRDTCANETDWIALQQKLAALSTASRRKELPAEVARGIRKAQAEAIASVAKSIRTSKSADARMQALQRALIGLRNDLLTMPQSERSAFAKVLAPALADMLAAAGAQWAAAHADTTMNAAYGAVTNSCEVLLRLLDRGERPQAYSGSKPESDARLLAAAWESGDQAKFDAEAKRWAGIVAAAPYR